MAVSPDVQSMDLNQAAQMIRWIDQERLKDKQLIATLREQVAEQSRRLDQQAERIQELQSSFPPIYVNLSRIDEFDEMVTNFKNELSALIEGREEQRKKDQREFERLRRAEIEGVVDQLHGLSKQLRVLPRYDEEIAILRAENQRLNQFVQTLPPQLTDLSKRSDERVQALTYLEEQRRSDTRRIAQLESDLPELRRRVNDVLPKFPPLEEAIRKLEVAAAEAVQQVKAYDKPIEEIRVAEFRRDQQMKKYLDQAEHVNEEVRRLVAETQKYADLYQINQRALKQMEDFERRLEKRQNEGAEMQRLSEERIRRQWEEWQVEQEKDRAKRSVLIEERWRQQELHNETARQRLDAIVEQLKSVHDQLVALWTTRRGDPTRVLKAVQDAIAGLAEEADENLRLIQPPPEPRRRGKGAAAADAKPGQPAGSGPARP